MECKKIIAGLFIYAGFASSVFSQTTGKIVDTNQHPVEGATIVMQLPDSTYLGATISAADGTFTLEPEPEDYQLIIQHLLYQTKQVKGQARDAGVITLESKDYNLEEVVIEGERPFVTVEQGKLNYDISAISEKHIVNNAYEAICKLPGVQDRNGKLSLVGAKDVTVILNGKASTLTQEQLIEMLKNTSASQVQTAEVMYNTPPEYHVRGAAINIVTAKADENTIQSELSASYSNQYFSSYSGNVNFLLTKGKSSLNVSYNPGYSHIMTVMDLASQHTYDGKAYDITQTQKINTKGWKHNIYAEYGYQINEDNELSVGYNGALSDNGKGTIDVNGNFQNSHNDKLQDSRLHNVFVRYSSGFGLDFGVDYTDYTMNDKNRLESKLTDNTRQLLDYTSDQKIRKFSVYADQSHALANDWTLKYGVRYDYTDNKNAQFFNQTEGKDDVGNSSSRLYEQITNFYGGFDKEFENGLSLSLSATGEYYSIGNYHKWAVYPQASLSYSPSEKHTFMLGVSSEKDYPTYWDMQTSTTYMNAYEELQTIEGLRPANVYSVNANYLFLQKYMLSLFYERTNDYFTMDMYQAKDRLALVYRTQNRNYYQSFGMSANVPFNIGEWLSSQVNATLVNDRNRCDNFWDIPFDRKKWACMLAMQSHFSVGSNLGFDLDAMYRSSMISGISDTKPVFTVNVGAQWNFLKDKASLSLNCADLFDTMRMKVRNRYAGQHIDLNMGQYSRTVSVKFVYRFGGSISKEKKEVDSSRFGR
ncbi:TonB-dependent receptor domain-containing protein [Phocaeicola sp.]|uniref:TonB-dependent receptor domain-containing protein n=1 Tax=Phocaeicola sp. TaxID=2773926 RepID=UPI003A9256BC